ncbi:intercellular trafficking and secretion [Apophysomyces sp. BC1034]|nr:intercellular trafficking and secretion [Apophysomyces sp. BC1015]KAG0193703.1 intercellular trafficking and secretion [Apophysomyces sp. BC1034]
MKCFTSENFALCWKPTSALKEMMNNEYDDVQWDVRSSADIFTAHLSSHEPVDTFTNNPYEDDEVRAFVNVLGILTEIGQLNTEQAHASTSYMQSTEYQNAEDVEDAEQIEETFAAKSMEVRVEDPQKRSEGAGSHIAYLIITSTTLETFSSPKPRPVRRRFQDFVWLHDVLILEFPACVVPPLPEKHRIKYFKGDRFSLDFIEKRRLGLQWFLDRIARHPYLQQSQCTRIFLESADFKNDKQTQSRKLPAAASLFDSLGDTFLNAFVKVKKPDDRFIGMKDSIDKLQDNLGTVERLYSRIGRRQRDLGTHYQHFATSVRGLSMLETSVAQPLQNFAETTDAYAKAMNDMINREDMLFLNDIHELLAYCNVVKEVLHERDQKQVDFEELSDYLQRAIQERERILYPGRTMGDTSGLNITEFMADKMNEVRGNDINRARQERLMRLELRIKELQDEVARTNDINNTFSSQMNREFDIFQKAKTAELKEGLALYADCHIEFYQKGLSVWENILPMLESTIGDEYAAHE